MMLPRYGSYETMTRLAVGGMGEIFLARQVGIHGFERLAIIKTLLTDIEGDEDRITMFLAEARVAALLNHPNVVQILEVGQEQGTYFIAMEYVDGETVSRIMAAALKRGRHMMWPFVHVVAASARALHHAHTTLDNQGNPIKLVHRDISPQNIMVRRDGVTKVVDFGIAKVEGASRTATGVVKGKLGYMAPEQLSSATVDGRADIFSLGVVLWETTVGKRLYQSTTEMDLLRLRTSETTPPPRPSTIRPDFPEALERVIMRSIQVRPEDRFQTAEEMAEALDEVIRQAPAGSQVPLGPYVEELVGEQVKARRSITSGTVLPTRNAPTPSNLQPTTGVSNLSGQLSPELSGELSDLQTQASAMLTRPGMPSSSGSMTVGGRTQTSGGQMVAVQPGSTTNPGLQADFQSAPTGFTMMQAPPQQRGVAPFIAAAAAGAALVVAGGGAAMFMLRPPTPDVTPQRPVDPPPAQVQSPPKDPVVAPVVTPPADTSGTAPGQAEPPDAVEPAPVDEPAEHGTKPGHKTPAKHPPKTQPGRNTTPVQKQPEPAPAPTAAPVAAAPGQLTISSKPWAEVSVDGTPLGTTPIFQHPLTPGTHTVVLEHPPRGLRKSMSVTIKAGENQKLKVDLE